MNKKGQAADFQRKPYAAPMMKAYEVKTAGIICASDGKNTTSSSNEEYTVESTTTTNGWFQ